MKKIAHKLLQHLLSTTTPQSVNDVVVGTSLAALVVRNNFNSLIKQGLVVREGSGRAATYVISDRPAAELKVAGAAAKAPAGKAAKKARKTKSKAPRETKYAIAEDPTLSFFLSQEHEIQIVRADGEGEAAIISGADALRLRAFLNEIAPVLEAA